jgi:hypothetical protein
LALRALADLERPALEQRIDHFEQEKRISGNLGHEVGEDLRDALAHAETRLHEPHLLLGREPLELERDDLGHQRRELLVGTRDEEGQHGDLVFSPQELRQ